MLFPGKIFVGIFLAMLLFNVSVFAGGALSPKRVFVLYSYEQDRPANLLVDHSLRTTFQAGTTDPIEFYTEYLDVTRFPEDRDLRRLLDLFRQKYATRKMDVIVTVNVPALDFMLKYGKELFPNIPIVFCGVAKDYIQSLTLQSHITGAVTELNLTGTLDVVLKLHPDIRRVVVVAGTSELDRFHEKLAREAFQEYGDRLEFTYLNNLPLDTLLKNVAKLPAKTIVFYLVLSQDSAGNIYVPQDVLTRISGVSNAPIYSFSDTYLGHGIVGGYLISFEAMGKTAAKIGLRILRGEQPANIPITEADTNLYLFDWRQLHRWGLHEQDLPPGSQVRYKELSLWKKHKWEIITVMTLCLIEALLIVILLIHRTMRKRAEQALRESERKLRDAQQVGRMGHWEFDLNTQTITWSEEVFNLYNRDLALGPPTPEEEATYYAPEQVKTLREYAQRAIETGQEFAYDVQAQLPGGRIVSFSALMRPAKDKNGRVVKLFGIVQDITERKQMEEALKASEARYRDLFNYISSGVAVYEAVENGRDFVFKDFNRAGEQIDKLSKDDLIGKRVLEIFPGIKEFGLFEVFQRVWQTGEPEYHPISLYQDRRIVGWRENYVYKLPSDEIVAVYNDVTGRKQAEQALRASERQYHLLIEHVTNGIGIIQDEQVVFVNNPMASMLGYTPEQLIGKVPVELFRGAYKHYFETISEQFESRLVEPHWHVVEFAVTRDNREVWLEGRHSVILWEGKSAILVTMRDITERKQREDEIEQEHKQLRQENIRLRTAMKERYRFGDIIGKSLPMQQVYELILKASATDASVVIYGESGTGKDLIAQMIHQLSERRRKAFVPVNCGSIQETLFEREFFGHRKGTFTGALSDKPGFFDAAHQGTLFLDEVGELSFVMQAKLLRAIDNKGYTPVGAQTAKYADVRIIAATNRNLKDLIKQGLMRKDFFYRINVIAITVPPLRERREDIPLLAEHFLKQYGKSNTPQVLPGRIVELLYHHDWPGNIRQLQNVLQRYLAFKRLMFDDDVHEKEPGERGALVSEVIEHEQVGLREIMEDVEKKIIAEALAQNHGNKSKTAEMLRIPRRTLGRKMEKYQIS